MVISHHGEPDFGAAVRPMFLEAEILSQLDKLDATIYEITSAVSEVKAGSLPADSGHLITESFIITAEKRLLSRQILNKN